MIRSFGDRRTEALFRDRFVPDFQGIAPRAKRKLEAINAASRLSDLAVPPSSLTESQNSRSRIYIADDPQDVVFRSIFIRIGGPEWTTDRVRGVKRALRAMSRRLGWCWAMPIDSSRCMITAWGC